MKKFKLITVMLSLFLLSIVNNIYSQQWSSEQKEVWAGVQKYWEINNSNPVAFLKYFDDSYLGWSYDNEAPGTKEDAVKSFTYWTSKINFKLNNLTPARIWVNGNFAFVHYYYTQVTENKDGTPRVENGRWTDILMKKNGTWMIIGDHGGEIKK